MDAVDIDTFLRESYNLPDSLVMRLSPGSFFSQGTFGTLAAPLNQLDNFKILYTALGQSGQEVVPSADGKIKTLLVAYPEYPKFQDLYKEFLEDLLKKLKDEEMLVIVFTQFPPGMPDPKNYKHMVAHLEYLQILFEGEKFTLHFVECSFTGFSPWVRDPFLAAVPPTKDPIQLIHLLKPYTFMRRMGGGGSMVTKIAGEIDGKEKISPLDFSVVSTPLIFHGGNTLIGDDFILIGKDFFDVEKNARECLSACNFTINGETISTKDDDIICDFKKLLSSQGHKEITVLNGGRPPNLDLSPIEKNGHENHFSSLFTGTDQPFLHLDLFITLVGRTPDKKHYQVIFPKFVNASDIDFPELHTKIIDPLNDWIKVTAGQLDRNKFKIHFINTPMTYFKLNERDTRRVWCWFSYNNCLVEVANGKKRVWLPTYGSPTMYDDKILYRANLPAFDEGAVRFFNSELKFDEITTLMNYTRQMLMGGSLHCLTNCLQRT